MVRGVSEGKQDQVDGMGIIFQGLQSAVSVPKKVPI